MAFGYKVRKVNMMRGNRQGNNAFLEESVHTHKTPLEYLLNSGKMTLENAFGEDTVKVETIKAIKESMDEKEFLKFTEEKVIPVLMVKGCVKTTQNLFEVVGIVDDKRDTFFKKTNYVLLLSSKEEEFAALTADDLKNPI